MSVLDNALVKLLLRLRLPSRDYAIFGSGPLLAHGIKDSVHDLDVIARGEAWKRVLTIGVPVVPPSGNGLMIELYDGSLQIFNEWTSQAFDVDELIDAAEWVEGVPFVPLSQVLRAKRASHRPKDLADIAAIERFQAVGRT